MATSAISSQSSQVLSQLGLNTNASGSDSASSKVSDQQNRFLTLLTTQLKNQDPLNPMDNAQVTSQLAQISTVDGISQLNQTLQKLIENSNQDQNLQAAALVGQGVLVAGHGLQLNNGQAVGGFELATAADAVKVTITDANGLPVRVMNLGAQVAGPSNFVWDGKSDSGASAANGQYTISVEASQSGKSVLATALQAGVVSSITMNNGNARVNVNGAGSYGVGDIKQIL